jgi:hypothetical protein
MAECANSNLMLGLCTALAARLKVANFKIRTNLKMALIQK